MQDLEFSMRAKGNLTPSEDATLRAFGAVASGAFILGAELHSFLCWFFLGPKFPKFLEHRPLPRSVRFGMAAGGSFISEKLMYYFTLRICAELISNNDIGEDRLKTELANIILTKHGDDKPLVEAVKKHFFAEHLFSDLHQDSALFRWHPHNSYTDSAFVERLKEIEDDDRSISRQATVNTRSFGDLMDDPLACVLDSQGRDMETHNLSETTGAVMKRKEPRNRRRCHRQHHHRYADKLAAV